MYTMITTSFVFRIKLRSEMQVAEKRGAPCTTHLEARHGDLRLSALIPRDSNSQAIVPNLQHMLGARWTLRGPPSKLRRQGVAVA